MTNFGNVIRWETARGRRQPEVTTQTIRRGRFGAADFMNCGSVFFRSEVIRLFRFGWNLSFTGNFFSFRGMGNLIT
jgi:hypothetical protein